MLRTNSLLTGLTLGAGAMYFFDAAQGARRRKLLADQCNHLLHGCVHDFDVAWRDLKNRAQGTAAEARRLVDFGDVPDEVVEQRVRAQLGHHVLHPRSIEVHSHGGHVTLRGHISGNNLFGLLRRVSAVPGVRTVSDELTVENHDSDGAARRRLAPAAWDFVSGQWAPSTKLLVGGAGAFLLAKCLTARRRSLTEVVLGTLGFGMLMRSLSPSGQGVASSWQCVEFHKTITIHAPVNKVFGFLTHPENWLLITNKIRNLRWHSDDAFAKDIGLPGMNLYCSERISCIQENECFVTDSLPDSWLAYHKELHFEPAGEHTRLHLKFNYRPPAGALGHAAAAVFGIDAKSFFDDFLMRAKNYLETGLQPHDVARHQHQHRRRQPVDAGPNVPPHEAAPKEREPLFPPVAEASLLIE
jgi:uncharacterized membrane protein